MSDYVSQLSDEDRGDKLRCLMTCPDYQGMDWGVGLRVWWRVRTMKAWIEVLGSDSDDVPGLWRHGQRCWTQILMTCQDYEGIDRGVDLRCLMTCQDYEGIDRGVDIRCLMTCQVHEANDRGVEDFRCLMTCKWLAEKSRRWLLSCLGFWGDKSRWRSRCCCKVVSLASKRSERKKERRREEAEENDFREKECAEESRRILQGFDATAAGGMHLHRAKTVADLNGLHFARNCARWGIFCFYVLAIFSPDLTAICFLSFLSHVNIMLFCWIVAPSLPPSLSPPPSLSLLLFNFLFTGFTRLMFVCLLCTMVLFALLFYHCQVFFHDLDT
jgi:hypothetical protein